MLQTSEHLEEKRISLGVANRLGLARVARYYGAYRFPQFGLVSRVSLVPVVWPEVRSLDHVNHYTRINGKVNTTSEIKFNGKQGCYTGQGIQAEIKAKIGLAL